MNIRKYLPIYLLTFVNIIGFSILIPILPGIVKQYLPENLVGLGYGLLLSMYAGFQFLAAPFLGSLSDRFGRRPLLFVSQLGTTLSWIIFGAAYFIPTDIHIFGAPLVLLVIGLSRITDGITGGNISVANAWVSDITEPKNRTKIFGMMGALFGVGFLFGPALGGFTSSTEYGFLATAIVAFLLSLVTLIFIYFKLPETLKEVQRDKTLDINVLDEINIYKQLIEFKGNRLISDLVLLRTFYSIVFASYTTLVILIYESEFGLSAFVLGLLLSLIGIFSFINQAFIGTAIAKRIGDVKSIYLSFMILFIGLGAIPLIPGGDGSSAGFGFWLLTIDAYIINVGISLGMPTFKSMFSKAVSDKKQGKIIGIDESLLSLGNAIAPAISGFVFVFLYRYTFVLFAAILLAPFLIIYIRNGNLALRKKRI